MTAARLVAVTAVVLTGGVLVTIGGADWRAVGDADIPTTRVARGTLSLDLHLTGELRARRSVPLAAPAATNPLRLVHLAETGTAVRAGDVVMEFDPVDHAHELEQSRDELMEVDQEIAKLEAEAAVRTAQARLDRMTARFDLRRAELDTLGDGRFLSRVEAERRALAVEEAARRLAELEAARPSQTAINRAELAVLAERRARAELASERARQLIGQLVVRAPIDGVVDVRENRDNATFFIGGTTLPKYRVGDTAFGGRPVLEIVDVSELEILAGVVEYERPNIEVGQSATVFVDGDADTPVPATVAAIAGMATRDPFAMAGLVPTFDAVLTLDAPDPRLRPGATVRIVVDGRDLTEVRYVPAQAVGARDGQPTVAVRTAGTFTAQPVRVLGRSAGRVAIEGVAEGAEVALVDVEPGP